MKEKINSDSKQIIFGSLLGDGSVFQGSRTKAFFRERHSIKQKEYLLWKNKKCFNNFGAKITEFRQYEKVQKKYYEKIELRSRSFPLFLDYRNMFYPDGKKIVNREILNQICELGLTVWYCDDGCYHLIGKTVRIMTDGFSYDEQKIIQKWFKEKWSLECKIVKRKTGSYYIGFDVKESERFLNIIRTCVPNSMSYKLGHLCEENKQRINHALERESMNKHKYYLNNRIKILSRQIDYRNKPEIKIRERLSKQTYYLKNKEKILESCKSYQKSNKYKIKLQKQIYYTKNKDKIKKRQKTYYLKNRAEIIRKQVAYKKRKLDLMRGV